MATYQKFNAFVEAVVEGKINLATDTLKVLLTNTAPVATNSVKADLTEISAGNGYTAGGVTAAQSSSSQSSGTYKLVLSSPSAITASGGSIGPLRYAVLYSDTATNKDLIAYWDYGSSITLASGESFSISFNGTTGVLTLS